MNKYRVLKSYPKQITNSGRIVTLRKGVSVYLKKESQVLRLVRMGFLKPVVEMPAKKTKPAKKQEDKESQDQSMRKSKSEYLNKKNKGKSKDEQSY